MVWIGVDAHKRLHRAVALGEDGAAGDQTLPNTPAGWAALYAWAQAWPERVWAVEGAASFGRGLAQFLAERGEAVREVNPRWTAQRRRSGRRPGKSDRLDALAVARLLREEAATLPVVLPEDPGTATAQLWSRLRDDLVADMTRLRNRLHALLLVCDAQYPRHVPRLTTQKGLAACLAYTAPGEGPLARARSPPPASSPSWASPGAGSPRRRWPPWPAWRPWRPRPPGASATASTAAGTGA